jgi:hypothetical protein
LSDRRRVAKITKLRTLVGLELCRTAGSEVGDEEALPSQPRAERFCSGDRSAISLIVRDGRKTAVARSGTLWTVPVDSEHAGIAARFVGREIS